MPVTIIWRERNKEVNLELGESFDFLSEFDAAGAFNMVYELRIRQTNESIFKVFTSFIICENALSIYLLFHETLPLFEGAVLEIQKLGNFKHSHLIVTYRFV